MQHILDGKSHFVCCDDAQGKNVNQVTKNKKSFRKRKNPFDDRSKIYSPSQVLLYRMPKVRLVFMEMYISAVFAMKKFRLIKIFSDSIKCGGKQYRKQTQIPETVWEESGRWQRVRDRESRMGVGGAKHTGNKKWKIIC